MSALNLLDQELPGMPAPAVLSEADRIKREIEGYAAAMKGDFGPLIHKSHAALALGVSPQRVHELVVDGRLNVWTFFGVGYVSLPQVLTFERKAVRGKDKAPRKAAA